MRCHISGVLGSQMGDGQLLIANTCGTSNGIAPPLFPLSGLTSQTASGSMAAWSAAITAAGGEYRLCWCSSFASCSAPDFIDMGELMLLGPSPLEQHRTCVSGLSCEFDGFLGKELSDLNKILLADTCGVASMPSSQITSLNTFGVSAVVSWGSLEISGGVYRLCWCSGQSDGSNIVACQAAEDFQTDAGSLTVIGVSPLGQEKTCISGFPCEIDGITGIYTSSGDQFLVLQTCGVSTTVPGFPASGVSQEVRASGMAVFWGSITAAGGKYLLCWCPGFGCSNLAVTKSIHMFFRDINVSVLMKWSSLSLLVINYNCSGLYRLSRLLPAICQKLCGQMRYIQIQ